MILPANPPRTMTGRTVLILANPYSGTGPNRRWVEDFAGRLRDTGLAPHIVWEPAQRRDTLRRHRHLVNGSAPIVIAAGGDGSIADVLNDMAAAQALHLPFTTLPVGNENLFARHFGIDRRRTDALANALADDVAVDHPRTLDLGRVTHADGASRLFSLMLGAGFDADVVHRVDRWRRDVPGGTGTGELRRVNWSSYGPRMAGALRQYGYPPITLTADDRAPITGAHVFVFNLPEYGKDLGICRDAKADDGVLNYVVFEKPGRLRLLNYLRAAAMGRHTRRADVKHGTARTLTLAADQPVPLQTDGDPAGTLQPGAATTVTVQAACLHVVGR